MSILRYGHDAWGQSIIDGVSWDLLGLAFGAGVAVIVIHAIWRAIGKSGRKGGN
jgi:hypothetical protein